MRQGSQRSRFIRYIKSIALVIRFGTDTLRPGFHIDYFDFLVSVAALLFPVLVPNDIRYDPSLLTSDYQFNSLSMPKNLIFLEMIPSPVIPVASIHTLIRSHIIGIPQWSCLY
jgi:hypothetical protein